MSKSSCTPVPSAEISACTSVFCSTLSMPAFSTSRILPRLGQLHRDDRGQALADVLAGEVVVLLLQQLLITRVLVDERGHGGAETLFVGAAAVRVDVVGEGVDGLRVLGVPLHRDLGGEG